ncbi:hypothetical protein N7507_002902 [Penicillium longicatenatum]|nr:hypothetical protein N7507_002902 [Penicillium longicatenatum]
MTTDLPQYFSPKRKRESSESDYYSPSASPTSTVSIASLQETRFREEEVGRHSPRAAVAGRFGELAIRGERLTNLGRLNADVPPEPSIIPPEQGISATGKPRNMPGAWPADNEASKVPDYQTTPELPTPYTNDTPTAPSVSPSKRKSLHPRKQLQPSSPSKHRKQRLSPPPAAVSKEDPFTWHDYEITGHDPTDPTDDGYGINGVGFKPTAAIAWARSQKRQKQVAEWKTREAREAREKRRQRRHESENLDRVQGIRQSSIPKRVKFDVEAEISSRNISPS